MLVPCLARSVTGGGDVANGRARRKLQRVVTADELNKAPNSIIYNGCQVCQRVVGTRTHTCSVLHPCWR
jgi:hypothetical protein